MAKVKGPQPKRDIVFLLLGITLGVLATLVYLNYTANPPPAAAEAVPVDDSQRLR